MQRVAKRIVLIIVAAVIIGLPASVQAKPKKDKKGSTEPGSYTEWKKGLIDELEISKTFKLSDYDRIVILPLVTKNTPLPEQDDNTYEPVKEVLANVTEIFLDGLEEGLSGRIDVAIVDEAPADEDAEGVLLIRGEVVAMEPGSRAARYFVGFGAGQSKVEIKADLIDAATGESLLSFLHARTSGIGVGGGKYTKFLTDDTVDVAKDAGEMLASF